jgi:acetyl esterase
MAGPEVPVEEVADYEVATADGLWIPVRVYRPDLSVTGGPILVYLHGGGWVVGTLETYDPLCRSLAARTGATLVSVGYRLAPENPYPRPLEDALAGLVWTAERAADLGGDRNRMVIAGDSAGGNLAAVLARRLKGRSLSLAGAALIYPVIDPTLEFPSATENAEGFLLETADMRWYWANYLAGGGDLGDPNLAPLRAADEDVAGLPPTLVLTAGFDPLRDEGEAYAARLAGAGVPVEQLRFPDQIHGFVRLLTAIDAASEALDAVAAFVRRCAG